MCTAWLSGTGAVPGICECHEQDTFWAWGVHGGYGAEITSFRSTNLMTWTNATSFQIKNSTEVGFSGICNNAVSRLDTPKGTVSDGSNA